MTTHHSPITTHQSPLTNDFLEYVLKQDSERIPSKEMLYYKRKTKIQGQKGGKNEPKNV